MTKLLSKEIIKKFDWKKVWYFRFKRLDKDTMLITNDLWAYSYLSNQEFQDFIKWWENLSEEKKKELNIKKFFKDTQYYKDDYKFEYWLKNNYIAFWPVLHIMVVTLNCDHKCKYCHAAAVPIKSEGYNMTEETARWVIDTMFYSTAKDIVIEFQWWEPLANWDIIKFTIEYANQKSEAIWKWISYRLVSNLSLMTDEKLEYLLEKNVNIATSLDWDEETHNFNRVYKWWNSHKNAIKWIKKINEIYSKDEEFKKVNWYNQKIWAILTTTKKTIERRKEVIDAYVENGLDWIFIRPLNPYGFAAAEIEELWYTSEEYLDFYKKTLDYIIEINKSWTLLREQYSFIFLSKIMSPADPNFLDDRSPCWAGIWQVAYHYNWNIYTCDEWRMLSRMWIEDFKIWKIEGNPKETYIDMITSETTNIMVESSTLDWMPWYEDSVYKPYMGVCPIYNYKMRGTVYPNFSIDTKRKIEYGVIDYLFQKMRDEEVKEIFKKWIRKPNMLECNCDC